MPPVAVAKRWNEGRLRRMLGWKVAQKFYPQCRDCSNRQGGLLAKAINAGRRDLHAVGGGRESYFHGRRWRIGHLTGGLVAVVTVGDGAAEREDELVQSSRERVRSFQEWGENSGKKLIERVQGIWKYFR